MFTPFAQETLNYFIAQSEKSKKAKGIVSAVKQKLEFLRNDPYYGHPIKKNMIPMFYRNKYDIKNLFWIELPLFWRMLYTLKNDEQEIEIIALIMEIVDHPTYDKRFGYRKKWLYSLEWTDDY